MKSITEYSKIIDDYIKWIRDNTHIRSVADGKYAEISSPFLDRHNDHIEIYAQKMGETFLLTDDGHTMNDLKIAGMEFNSPKRQQVLNSVLNGFGVKLGSNDDLYVEANLHNIGQKKHYLIQAILAVDDMFVLAQENIFSFFKEDVERFFSSRDIYFTKDIKISGKSGFDHNVDFVISASKAKPERLIKTVNYPKKDSIMSIIFAFSDINAIRETPTRNMVIYNDQERQVSNDVLAAIQNYGVIGVPWSQKEEKIEEFQLV